MKIALAYFTLNGKNLSDKLSAFLSEEENEIECAGFGSLFHCEEKLSSWAARNFETKDLIIFIGSTGIAVRTLSPFVKSKLSDPAVLVIDEMGKFVIPLLSGHFGGANDFAKKIALHTKSVPVITTATDLNGLFAVDVFAKKNNLIISDLEKAKLFSSRILQTKSADCKIPLAIKTDVDICTSVPPELCVCAEPSKEPVFSVSPFTNDLDMLCLVPRNLIVGIGCKKNMPAEKIQEVVTQFFKRNNLNLLSIKKICSIDVKAQEKGLVDYAEKQSVPFETFSAEMLCGIQGNFSTSDFVKKTVGVDNVCERSAVCGGGRLFLPKQAFDGVTVAVAVDKITLSFGE